MLAFYLYSSLLKCWIMCMAQPLSRASSEQCRCHTSSVKLMSGVIQEDEKWKIKRLITTVFEQSWNVRASNLINFHLKCTWAVSIAEECRSKDLKILNRKQKIKTTSQRARARLILDLGCHYWYICWYLHIMNTHFCRCGYHIFVTNM